MNKKMFNNYCKLRKLTANKEIGLIPIVSPVTGKTRKHDRNMLLGANWNTLKKQFKRAYSKHLRTIASLPVFEEDEFSQEVRYLFNGKGFEWELIPK